MMKIKKALLALLITSVLTATLIIGLSADVKAETGSKYFGLYHNSNNRPTDSILTPTDVSITTQCVTGTNPNKPVIKINEYNNGSSGSTPLSTIVYCLKAGAGFGSSTQYSGNTITNYTYYHNLKDKSGMANAYQSTLPSGDYYNEMVWVLDHLIDPRDGNTSDDSAILTAAGTSLSAFKSTRNGTMDDERYANVIEAVQQCVIWYFTNREANNQFTQEATTKTTLTGGSNSVVHTLISGIHYGSSANSLGTGTALTTLYNQIDGSNTPAGKLAYYYISQAIANKDTALSSSTNTASFDKSRATIAKVDGYYYVGPYKYTGVNASSVTITTPNSVPYTLVKAANASGAELSGGSDLAKINGNKNTDFYIKVPMRYNNRTVTGTVSINVKASYTNKTLTYWNVAGAANNNQPLVVIAQTPGSLNESDAKDVSNPVFDLALRKYITRIESADGTVKYSSTISNRTPSIATPPAFNLDDGKTARKTHEKDALQVEKGDKVTYTITVYNEGTVAGTNVTVTDYLPSGLTYKSGGWTSGTAANGYTPYTLNFGTVAAYDEGNTLPSVSKTIVCEVTADPGTSNRDLKNIAQISSASGGTDRDSQPGNLTPSSSYAPSTAEQGKGVQDDDDYEHIYLGPQQDFDLAIRKYITKIESASGTVKFNNTNRIPSISTPPTFNLTNGTTARKAHEKDALKVEPGDKVTYKITVYNEADIAGTNVVVTDYLPTGLTYQSTGSDGWTPGTAANGYTPYTLNYGTVAAYNGGNTLPSVTKTMVCTVSATAGDNRIDLKNIAQISSASGGTDRDSQPGNLTPSSSYAPSTAEQGLGVQDDDDYEHLYIAPLQEFDLALRKYITEIKSASGTVKYSDTISNRTPTISTPPTFNLGQNRTTATKAHEKDALKVEEGDTVTYKITVYNEGDIAGTNITVTDYLPAGLTYQTTGSDGWTAGTAANGYTPYTLNYGTVAAYNGGNTLPSVTKTMVCKVTATAGSDRKDLKNIAEITSSSGGTDRDSTPGTITPSNNYNPSTAEQGMGVQDDDDFEHLYLEPNKDFDLAIRKYITEVKKADGTVKYSSEQLSNRTPKIANPPAFNLGQNHTTATKAHEKDAIKVESGDLVTYTITVYNEGELAASNVVVTDYLPNGLSYKSGGWTAGTAANGYTPYTLSFGNVTAYDGGSTLPSVSKTITCEVTANAGDNRIDLKNITEITSSTGGNDRDSAPKNLTPSNDYNPSTAEQGMGVQDDDDYEHLYIEPNRIIDLALRKHIIKVTGSDGTTVKYSEQQLSNRDPSISTPPTFNLDNGTTAGKTHTKAALSVSVGDLITYRINVYNEGNVVGENVIVTDYVPEGLEVVSEGWTKGEKDAKGYTAYTKTYPSIPVSTGDALGEAHADIVCKVVGKSGNAKINLKNIAEITSPDGDRDSQPGTITPDENYNPEDSEKGKGIQDDDDFEDVVIEPNTFDLALKKFIAAVNNKELKTNGVYDRAPSVDTSKRDGDKVKSFTYTFSANKEPIAVENNDIITYVIRVYNEGGKAGYAKQIKDDIPQGLVFLPDNQINTKNGWYMIDSSGKKTTDVNKAVSVVTDSYGYGKDKARLLKAFDQATMANKPDYFDVEIAFKVAQPAKENKERIVINSAQISDDSDENGNDVEDVDSDVDNMTPGKPSEDDEDIEKIYVKYFDLALKKWVTQAIVIEDGKQTVKNTGHKPEDNPEELVKVEVNKKRIESTVIKFKYSIRVTNEGEIPGAATEISEYVPDGLKFDPADNPKWKQSNGKITTDALKDKILKPGEYADVEITLTWINNANNVKAMNNIAEISDDYNESGTPDRDSIPNNKKDGEDDIDDAPVIVTMVTGSKPTYFLLAGSVLAIIVSGATLLKKYVLS